MISLSKKFVLIMIFILVASGLLVESCVAPVAMPADPISAPDVSVVVHNNPEWVSPVYTTDPYTGEVMESSQGYWRASGTIEITVKNRPFTPYTDKNGNNVNVYYSFFTKTTSLVLWDDISRPRYAVYQSDSVYTVVTFRYGEKITSDPENLWSVHDPGQLVDFRVQAVTGYFNLYSDVFEGEGSAWAEFTVTIPSSDKPGTSTVKPPSTSNPNSTPSQTTSQQNPLQPNLLIILFSVCIIVVLLSILVYLLFSRQRKTNPVDGVGVLVREVKT